MFVYNELVAILAKHKILALFTFPTHLSSFEWLIAIIAKEPIMINLFLWNQFLDYLLFYLLLFLLSLFTHLLLFFFLLLLSSLTFLLSSLWFLSQGVLDVTRILSNRCSSRLFESKIILSFILIHLLTSLFILLIDYFNLFIFFWFMLRGNPFFIKDIILKE